MTRDAGAPRRTAARLELEKSAGAVVFFSGAEREYLLVLSSYWEFPKGLVEPNESEREAAAREVREETGLAVELISGFREEISYFYRRGDRLVKKQVVYFLGKAVTRDVQISWEHTQARWLPFAQALEQLKYENARELLRRAEKTLSADRAS